MTVPPRRRRAVIALLALLCGSAAVGSSPVVGETDPGVELEPLLENLAQAAEQFLSKSWSFTALETARPATIVVSGARPPSPARTNTENQRPPYGDSHVLPALPRPAVCSLATTTDRWPAPASAS